ncbi:hypothetical protein [Virgibacillus sp. DJP39]|uniref:hypothetical protein n=1 Tax=Virgibacillus sp. DJP39 TaxID=3409790 RepID=UPI003BB48F30
MKEDKVIFEKFLLFDIKLWVEETVASLSNPFHRIIKRYELGTGDYENSILAETAFIRLGWSNNSKDIINSFWGTFTCALVEQSKENSWTYSDVSKGQCTDSLYDFDNDFKITYCAWNPTTKLWGKFVFSKNKFGEKFFAENNLHREKAEFLLDKYPEFIDYADICDSIANFTPCPSYPYNSLKGFLPDVKDYLNLMVDKIQECIDSGKGMKYDNDKKTTIAKIGDLIKWKNWFITNQKAYHLEEYYSIENDRIKGIPLFEKQSLSHPIPKDEEEVKECVNEMMRRINNRAKIISNDLK